MATGFFGGDSFFRIQIQHATQQIQCRCGDWRQARAATQHPQLLLQPRSTTVSILGDEAPEGQLRDFRPTALIRQAKNRQNAIHLGHFAFRELVSPLRVSEIGFESKFQFQIGSVFSVEIPVVIATAAAATTMMMIGWKTVRIRITAVTGTTRRAGAGGEKGQATQELRENAAGRPNIDLGTVAGGSEE